jgi:hypothetical protein
MVGDGLFVSIGVAVGVGVVVVVGVGVVVGGVLGLGVTSGAPRQAIVMTCQPTDFSPVAVRAPVW